MVRPTVRSLGDDSTGFLETAGPIVHSALRFGAGILFLQHGLQKLFGLLGGMGSPGSTAPLASLMGVAGLLEFFGGLLIIFGLATRAVSVVLLVEMVAAYFISHLPQGGWPVQNRGELALLYALVFLFLSANGGGPYSLDELLRRRAQWGRRTAA
ncbi:MAG: DoxX family protein [Acidobacteria bacterium]|nr:MAG: DoxX family protein [Acidobacteriota bacterium]